MIIIAAIIAGWSVLALAGSLVLGRMVATADERRPTAYDFAV